MEVEGELVETGVLDVVPGLEMRDVEGVADAGDVRAEERVRRPEERQNAVLYLAAYLQGSGGNFEPKRSDLLFFTIFQEIKTKSTYVASAALALRAPARHV